uniref:RNase H type-1 domain-containing protein n=1 Tax=Kalanchoe fedtschenkoi TaxID=63787 RepID=A0A7N0VFB6_KALFE
MMESDLDVAYNLQLQEALIASAGSAPASSSLTNPTAELSFSTYSPVSDATLTVGAGVNDDNEDVRVLMRFMEENADLLEHEMTDRELSEAEARRLRDELNRRVHDQKVAAASLAMPEEERAKTGDYFEKPYGEGSSSGGGGDGIAIDENFRVYVKGMVSEERVKDAVVSMAGLGVAIYDPRDYLILEIRKPLVGKDEGVLSTERVGFEALVEGLKAANELGLKRVSCFCDEYMIHQYVRKLHPFDDYMKMKMMMA